MSQLIPIQKKLTRSENLMLWSALREFERVAEAQGIETELTPTELLARALTYYLDHTRRFGLTAEGWPRAEASLRGVLDTTRSALDATWAALRLGPAAHEAYATLPARTDR